MIGVVLNVSMPLYTLKLATRSQDTSWAELGSIFLSDSPVRGHQLKRRQLARTMEAKET